MLAVGASDDAWATPAQVDALTAHLPKAPVERRTYAPHDLGVSSIGHHGLLRLGTVDGWVDDLLSWFRTQEQA